MASETNCPQPFHEVPQGKGIKKKKKKSKERKKDRKKERKERKKKRRGKKPTEAHGHW